MLNTKRLFFHLEEQPFLPVASPGEPYHAGRTMRGIFASPFAQSRAGRSMRGIFASPFAQSRAGRSMRGIF
ncbi:hypothetical protein J7E73_30810, partial [Paenibacillus albidus]|uniref:hypothetical protein n=1 Tax=Paenibacillus albidus TaxID=2041023 RepID=UPI001BEC8C46